MLRELRVQNLRSIVDTGFIRLSPITILVGANSSGKSTFLRTFPLLKQSIETNTSGPIVWFGRYVDFGSAKDAVRADSSPQQVILSFKLSLSPRNARMRYLLNEMMVKHPGGFDLELSVRVAHSEATSYLAGLTLDALGYRVNIEANEDGDVKVFTVNDTNILNVAPEFAFGKYMNVIPILQRKSKDENVSRGPMDPRAYPLLQPIQTILNQFDKRVAKSISLYSFSSPTEAPDVLSFLKNASKSKLWKRKTAGLKLSDNRVQNLAAYWFANCTPDILVAAREVLAGSIQRVAYVQPSRQSAQRYYRLQDVSVVEMDPQGENLAMFLKSLTSEQRQSFQTLVGRFLGVYPTLKASSGHIELLLKDDSTGNSFNLADVGFGYAQVLPVFAQLWSLFSIGPRRRSQSVDSIDFGHRIFAVEQPELHLHPAAQLTLADLLAETIGTAKQGKLNLCCVVETHSETIVNRLGALVAKRELDRHDVQVLVFERDKDTKETRVTRATYDDDGALNNWPFGFFLPEVE